MSMKRCLLYGDSASFHVAASFRIAASFHESTSQNDKSINFTITLSSMVL